MPRLPNQFATPGPSRTRLRCTHPWAKNMSPVATRSARSAALTASMSSIGVTLYRLGEDPLLAAAVARDVDVAVAVQRRLGLDRGAGRPRHPCAAGRSRPRPRALAR